MNKVRDDITTERKRQDEKWGMQNHDNFTWLAILGEEFGEAQKAALEYRFGNSSLDDYRKELIHVAAVAVAAIECFDRHNTDPVVYLAGPIKGCTKDQTHSWREEVADFLHCKSINPAAARDFSKQECDDCMNIIVNPDKHDIDAASILLANCWQVSVGTSMEILYAWERGKIVISVVPREQTVSAWIIAHSHVIVNTLDDAINWINATVE